MATNPEYGQNRPVFNVDYDHVQLYEVDTRAMVTASNNLKDLDQAVADSLERINKTWTDLKLGWAGKTSDEAKEFLDRWNAVMQELFGTKDHPESGVLNVIVEGVLMAATLYGQTELLLSDFFYQFLYSLGGDGGSPSDTPPPSITDITTTAVTETWG